MKFYEFNDFPYYALIVANDEEEAMEIYVNTVCDLDDDDEYGEPEEICNTLGFVLWIMGTQEDDLSFEEVEEEFHQICSNKEGQLLLVDNSLL